MTHALKHSIQEEIHLRQEITLRLRISSVQRKVNHFNTHKWIKLLDWNK